MIQRLNRKRKLTQILQTHRLSFNIYLVSLLLVSFNINKILSWKLEKSFLLIFFEDFFSLFQNSNTFDRPTKSFNRFAQV